MNMALEAPMIITFAATLVLFVTCVIIHYEGLSALTRWVSFDLLPPRVRIATLICGQFVLHLTEICIFAVGYFVLAEHLEYGALLNVVYDGNPLFDPSGFADYVYYSAVAYTTLGMGEIVPIGPLRFLTGMEAVGGLLLITWSASFTFIEMQRYWGRD
jgi:hypothetical protein